MELRNGTALRKLQGTARLLELATAAGPNGVVVVDATLPDYPIIFANRGFEKMSGYLAKEVLGRNCRFMRDLTEEQPDLNALRAAVSEGREWSGVLRNYRKDGSPFWNELHISPIRDAHGQLTNFVGVLSD